MARRYQKKEKEPVKIRFKRLANDNQSIYLDCYKDGNRTYEFLGLYLVPEVDEATKIQNENTMNAATAIKSERVLAIIKGKAGLDNDHCTKVLLTDWLDKYKDSKHSKSNATNIAMLKRHILIYNKGKAVKLQDVDKAYCKGFIKYLSEKACALYGKNKVNGKRICKNTASTYFVHLACALNAAVKEGIIPSNPTKLLSKDDKKPIKSPKPQRGYLTIDEIKTLMATDNKNIQVKQAFLFAVFCGLRISDVRALKWDDFAKDGNQWKVSVLMQKTQKRIYLPLSDEAMRWLPDRGNTIIRTQQVFDKLPKHQMGLNSNIKRWAKRAGIEKDICFHVSRHTFATTLLTLGADLYTTSKLLGHSKVATTEIYAEIIDEKKEKAVNLVNGVF